MEKFVWVGGPAGKLVVLTKGLPGYVWKVPGTSAEPVPEMPVWMMAAAGEAAAVMAKGA